MENGQTSERGRLQRNGTSRPNYNEHQPRVFGLNPRASSVKEKKKNHATIDASENPANPTNPSSVHNRPRGRPPKGKKWDHESARYVDARQSSSTDALSRVAEKSKAELASEVAYLKNKNSKMEKDIASIRSEMVRLRAMVSSYAS